VLSLLWVMLLPPLLDSPLLAARFTPSLTQSLRFETSMQ
jgi:hypothetical protein